MKVFEQPDGGYRANVDAVLLARFAAESVRTAKRVVDLGAGAGLVGLTLLETGVGRFVHFVEIDAVAARFARTNLAANGWGERADVHVEDVVSFARAHRGIADLIVANPPYVEPGRGRPPRDSRRALARVGSLESFAKAARLLLGSRGRVCFVYPASELVSALETLRGAGLEPKRMRMVHARSDRPARVVLVEVRAGKRGGLKVEKALLESER